MADTFDRVLVDISVCSRFHAFDLARELSTHGMLRQLHTGYPSFLAARWGMPRRAVRSVWSGEPVHRALHALHRRRWIAAAPDPYICERHDRIVASRLRLGADIFIGWSSQCRRSLAVARQHGMVTIVERGSTHIEWQQRQLEHEACVTGLEVKGPHPRSIAQELAEYESADYIAVPSSFAAKTFIAAGVPAAKLLVNPFGVNLDLFSDATRRTAPADEALHVLHVGGVTARKGVHYLIDAVRSVPAATLTLVGSVTSEMADRVRGHDGVTAIGAVPGNELPHWYRSADVFCLLSIEEGQAMVLFQAMAMGLPVIATPNTGAEDVIDDGVQGFIVPARDPKAAAERLRQLAAAPDLRRAMGERARARVSQRFSWADYGARARAIYKQVARPCLVA